MKRDCANCIKLRKLTCYNARDCIEHGYKYFTAKPSQQEQIQFENYNNGGLTDYYQFKSEWNQCQDIIEDRQMNFSQGNILKAAFCFNQGRHGTSTYERELNKIIWFANRELERIKSK